MHIWQVHTYFFIFCYLILANVLIITKGSSYRILRLKMHKNSQYVDKYSSSWANFYSDNVKIRDKIISKNKKPKTSHFDW